jgi:DNA-binding MarR family transcriptional regulator
MHKLVAELSRRGLVAMHHRPGHGRILDAQLTAHGRDLVADADARAQAIEDRMTAGLDKQQRRQLLDLLQHCITTLDVPSQDVQPTRKPAAHPDTASRT